MSTVEGIVKEIEELASKKEYDKIIISLADKASINREIVTIPQVDEKLKEVFSTVDSEEVIVQLAGHVKRSPTQTYGVLSALALAYIGKSEVVPHVVAAIVDGDGFGGAGASLNQVTVVGEVKEIITHIGSPAVAPLLGELEKYKDNGRATKFIAQLLENISTKENIPAILEYLEHDQFKVREIIASTLTKLDWQAEEEHQKIVYLVASQKWDELKNIGDPAVDELTRALDYAKHHVFPYDDLVKTLGEIGNPMAVDGLVDVLSHDYMVRTIPKATIQALGQIGDKRSILPLVDHVKNAPFLRRPKAKVYAEALLKIAEKYPDEVKAALQDDHRRVKRVAKHVRKKI